MTRSGSAAAPAADRLDQRTRPPARGCGCSPRHARDRRRAERRTRPAAAAVDRAARKLPADVVVLRELAAAAAADRGRRGLPRGRKRGACEVAQRRRRLSSRTGGWRSSRGYSSRDARSKGWAVLGVGVNAAVDLRAATGGAAAPPAPPGGDARASTRAMLERLLERLLVELERAFAADAAATVAA